MRRVIGIDIHRTFGEVVFWEAAGSDGRAASNVGLLILAALIAVTLTVLSPTGWSGIQ